MKEGYPLFESIKYDSGVLFNLEYHFNRMQSSCKKLYGKKFKHTEQISSALQSIELNGLHKIKLMYSVNEYSLEIHPYQMKKIKSLSLVEDNHIVYTHKFSNRRALDSKVQKGKEVIIIQNKLLTDSSYANLALWNGEEWHTPKKPLLKGTKRQYLLDEDKIREVDIAVNDLQSYHKISLINAMMDLGELVIRVEDIIRTYL